MRLLADGENPQIDFVGPQYKKTVSLDHPINKVGEYTMLIKLTSKVKTELTVNVTASEILKEEIEEVAETTEEA